MNIEMINQEMIVYKNTISSCRDKIQLPCLLVHSTACMSHWRTLTEEDTGETHQLIIIKRYAMIQKLHLIFNQLQTKKRVMKMKVHLYKN